MDKSTNGVKSQSVSKSQNNISRLGQPWDNGGTNLLFTGMNDDSKQKAQVLDSFGLFLWCPGRGERIRTSGLYVPNVALYQAKLHPAAAVPQAISGGQEAEPLIVANLGCMD